MIKKRMRFMLVMLFMATFLIAGCSNEKEVTSDEPKTDEEETTTEAPKNEEVTVHLYTSESQDLVGAMMKDFEEKHPGIKVEIFRSGTEQVITKMEAERSAGGIVADMIWFADIDYFNTLDQEGLLEEYKSPNAEGLKEEFVYNGGKYYEVRQIFNVIAYNTTKVTNPPKSWNDLYQADFKSKAAMASPNYSGAAFLTLATLVNNDQFGWDYFQSLKDNDLKFEQGNGGLASKIATGEYSAVSVVDFMARNAKNEGSPVEVVWPEEGAIIIPTPVGIIKDSDALDASKKVMDYLLSEECQITFKEQGYIPVNGDVGVPENAPNVADIKIMPLDLNFLKEKREELKSKFSEIFDVK